MRPSQFEDVCCTHYLWWSLLRFFPKHNDFRLGDDKHARIADTLSTTVWDVWQEYMRKGDQSIDAPATSFGAIPYSPPRKYYLVEVIETKP